MDTHPKKNVDTHAVSKKNVDEEERAKKNVDTHAVWQLRLRKAHSRLAFQS